MYDGDPPTLVSLYGRKLRMVIWLRTFTTLDAWHCVNRRTKATAVASTELRPGIGAWPVAVTHSLATCHATFRPIGIRGVSAMNWNEWTKRCEGKKGAAGSFVFFLSSECLRLYITEFFFYLLGQLCTLQDLRCKTWRLLTLIMRSLIPPPHDLSHWVKAVVNTLSTTRIRISIDKYVNTSR